MSATRPSLRFAALLSALTILLTGMTALMPHATPAADAAVRAKPGTKLFGMRVIAEAKRHNRQPYVYGARGPNRFDCSGYAQYVIRKSTGKKLPRTSSAQYRATKRISKRSIRPGDLVFFKSSSGRVYHVAIYAGGGKIWHASNPRTDVVKAKIWTKRWSAGRVR